MSLPLLIKRLNVPEAVFGETTSHLMLSLVPLVSVLLVPVPPSESCSAPSARVSSVNAVPVPVPATPPPKVAWVANGSAPDPVDIVTPLYPVPTEEPDNANTAAALEAENTEDKLVLI